MSDCSKCQVLFLLVYWKRGGGGGKGAMSSGTQVVINSHHRDPQHSVLRLIIPRLVSRRLKTRPRFFPIWEREMMKPLYTLMYGIQGKEMPRWLEGLVGGNSDVYPCQPLATSMILVSLCSPCGGKTLQEHRWGSGSAVHFYLACPAVDVPNTSIIFTSEFNIAPWEITQLQLSHDGSYRDTGFRSMLLLACWRQRMSVVVLQKKSVRS